MYYTDPTQVRFWVYEQTYIGGIAYHDFIVCGHCGVTLKIDEIIQAAEDEGIDPEKAIIEMEWLDINKAILGK